MSRKSPATASQVLTQLDRLGWSEARGRGPEKERHLSNPTALLDEWVKQVASLRAPDQRRYYVPNLKGDAIVERLAQLLDSRDVEYAVSYEAAAQHYAPFLSTLSLVRVRVLAGSDLGPVMKELGAREVNEGANLVIIHTAPPGDFFVSAADRWVLAGQSSPGLPRSASR